MSEMDLGMGMGIGTSTDTRIGSEGNGETSVLGKIVDVVVDKVMEGDG